MDELQPSVLSVSDLNALVRDSLEYEFSHIVVEGEISNLARPASGHLYFSLKDSQSSVSCVLFKGALARCALKDSAIDNGVLVQCRGSATLYAPRGQYQLVLTQMSLAGQGQLEKLYQERLARLAQEGIFAPERKKNMPQDIQSVGVITSASGAAIHDVLSTIKRRNPYLQVILYPSLVQGEKAAEQLGQQIIRANCRKECDVLLLVRGGGSLEDLWAFNDEDLARTIAASTLPIISGVGHEVDTTLADFAADLRAPTPTAAAEQVSILAVERLQQCDFLLLQQQRRLETVIRAHKQRLTALHLQLNAYNPKRQLQEKQLRLQSLAQKMHYLIQGKQRAEEERLARLKTVLSPAHLQHRLQRAHWQIESYEKRMKQSSQQRLAQAQANWQLCAQKLANLNPLAVLSRGYAVMSNAQGEIVKDARTLLPTMQVQVRLANGQARCEVKEISPNP